MTGWALDFADIQYYEPESILDYIGVLLQIAAGLTTGVALFVLWRDPPDRFRSTSPLGG